MSADILVVDDNQANLDQIACLRCADGYAPRLASGGVDGVAVEAPPDLIKRSPTLTDTRIVAVTAPAMADDRSQIRDAGFDRSVLEPIDKETFVGEIERLLARDSDGG